MNNPLKYTDPSGYHVLPNKHDYNAWLLPPPKGGGGFAGPGSGNHWSDPYRTENGNWMLGNHASFDGIYGEGAFDSYYNQHYTQQTKQNTTTGNVAEKDYGTILAWMQMTLNEKDWQVTIFEAFGNTTVIGSFNDPGTIRPGVNGGLIFSNPTASAMNGEAQVTGEKGSILRRVNNFNTLLGISLFGIDRTLSFTRLGRDISYNFAYTSFAKASNFIKPIGYGTSFAGMFIGGFKFAASDQSWGDYGQLGISLLSSGLTINPSTAPLGIAIGGADILGGFNGFYNYLDTQQQLYENTGGIMIYTNQFPVFIPISTRP
ncbi:MAG: hypothetical protein PF694_01385 [Bacteroidetes bacterium]|jgi:hypothetical protein|nr:hypothetical protein [Bacteroidota bacterium]